MPPTEKQVPHFATYAVGQEPPHVAKYDITSGNPQAAKERPGKPERGAGRFRPAGPVGFDEERLAKNGMVRSGRPPRPTRQTRLARQDIQNGGDGVITAMACSAPVVVAGKHRPNGRRGSPPGTTKPNGLRDTQAGEQSRAIERGPAGAEHLRHAVLRMRQARSFVSRLGPKIAPRRGPPWPAVRVRTKAQDLRRRRAKPNAANAARPAETAADEGSGMAETGTS